jgi:hypothetical protein
MVSKDLSQVVSAYIDELILDTPDDVLKKAQITDCGKILDERIILFQGR